MQSITISRKPNGIFSTLKFKKRDDVAIKALVKKVYLNLPLKQPSSALKQSRKPPEPITLLSHKTRLLSKPKATPKALSKILITPNKRVKSPQLLSVRPRLSNLSQTSIKNSDSFKLLKRWSIVAPLSAASSKTARAKATRNNQIISPGHNGELVVIQNSYTKSFIDNQEEIKQNAIKETEKSTDNNNEEQVTVIENDCDNDYSLLIKSLNIHN